MLIREEHFRALENMYLAAPINAIYRHADPCPEGEASIGIALSEQFHHSDGAVHFKMLDDAARY